MQNTIPAITGELIKPLLETSNWQAFHDEIGELSPNSWIKSDDSVKYTYEQSIIVNNLTIDDKFFVDLDLSQYDNDETIKLDDIFIIQEEWALISRAVSSLVNNSTQVTFYIYEDTIPTKNLKVKIRFANT